MKKIVISLVVVAIILFVINSLLPQKPSLYKLMGEAGYTYNDKNEEFQKEFKLQKKIKLKYTFNPDNNNLNLNLLEKTENFDKMLTINYNFLSDPNFIYEYQKMKYSFLITGSFNLLTKDIEIEAIDERLSKKEQEIIKDELRLYFLDFNQEQEKLNNETILRW